MPRNSSGNYTLPAGNPVVADTLIESGWANPTMADLGAEITNSLDRQGRGTMLAPLKLFDGTVVTPGLSFNAESSTGLYRAASHVLGIAVAGVAMALFTDTDVTFSKNVIAQQNISVTGTTTLTGAVTANGAVTLNGAVSLVGAVSLTAPLNLPLGTPLLPSLTFTGDPNTGMYSPGADNVGWATGGLARGGIGATGNWAIPAPTVGDALTVASITGAYAISVVDANPLKGIKVGHSASSNGLALLWDNANSKAVLDTLGVAWPWSIRQAGAERVGISAAGNVVIAAASAPTLNVNGSGAIQRFTTTTARGSGANYFDFYDPTGAKGFIGYPGADDTMRIQQALNSGLDIYTNNAIRLSLAAAGNVTVNAPASAVPLTINGIAANPGINIVANAAARAFATKVTDFAMLMMEGTTAGSTSNGIGMSAAGGGGVGIEMAREGGYGTNMKFYTNPSTNTLQYGAVLRMSISSDGNVAINAPGSGTALTVIGTGTDVVRLVNDNAIIRAYNSAGSLQTGYLHYSVGGTELNVAADGGNTYVLNLVAGGVRRVVVNTNGAVQIPAQPTFRATASAGFGASGSAEMTAYGATAWNTGGFVAGTGRFTPPVAGKYLVMASGSVTAGGNAVTAGQKIMKNGTTLYAQDTNFQAIGTAATPSCCAIVDLNGSTDYVSVFYSNSAAVATNVCDSFSAWLVG